MAKHQLISGFSKADLGTWVKKPIEQDQFSFDESVFKLTAPVEAAQ